MRLTRLLLRNWRNFKEADLEFRNRLFVIGPNASGKSNLLDALRFLKQIASPGGGFQNAVTGRGGLPQVRCLAARSFNHGHVSIAIAIEDQPSGEHWSYTLTFSAERRGRHRPILTAECVKCNDEVILQRPTPQDRDDPELMTQTHIEQVTANRDFRRIVDFLGSIRYLHPVPHLIREPDRFWIVPGFEGQNIDSLGVDFLHRIAQTPAKTRTRRLHRIQEALKSAVPQLDGLELAQDDVGTWHLRSRYHHWRPNPAIQNEQQFSDGTLRLIVLLWSLLDTGKIPGILLLEEPELSLHPSIVRQLPSVFHRIQSRNRTQILVTTHSADMLKDEGLGADEVVLLKPGPEGTESVLATAIDDIDTMLNNDLSLADILISKTEPENVTYIVNRVMSR